MDMWVIWFVAAVVLGVAEIFTLTAALGLLGRAALITSAAAAIGLPVPLQFVVFAVASVAGIVVLRPVARRHLTAPPSRAFGVDALVGRPGYVLEEVTGRDGRIRIGGEEWSARAFLDDQVIEPGTRVEVVKIEGATALVYE